MAHPRTVTILFTYIPSTEFDGRAGDDKANEIRPDFLVAVRRAIEASAGKDVKILGEGVMAAFDSGNDALDCATAVQRSFEHNPTAGGGELARPRVGISSGDATRGEDDWAGPPVVEASRLCAAAPPGHIYVSEIVRALTASRDHHRFTPLEDLSVKGIAGPLRAFDLEWKVDDNPTKLSVVIAEDSVLLREGVARLLVSSGFDVIGQVGAPDQLMEFLARTTPDVVILDIRMPPTHTDEGIRAANEIRSLYPEVGVLVLSQYLETEYAMGLLEERSDRIGYLLKDRVTDVQQMTEAVERICRGESVIDPEIVSRLLKRRRERDPLQELSERENDVLRLMAEGLSNQAICDRLFLSAKTVETHIRSLFAKLGIIEDAESNRRVRAVLAFLRSDS